MDNEKSKDFNSQFAILCTKCDPLYGELQVFQNRQNPNEKLGLIKRLIQNKDKVSDRYEALKQRRQSFNHQNILKFYRINLQDSKDLCSSLQILTIAVQYISQNLTEMIKQRTKSNTFFTEPEIWYIARSTASALAYLQQQKHQYIDLHPNNILIDHNGYIKLVKFNYKYLFLRWNQLLKNNAFPTIKRYVQVSETQNTFLQNNQLVQLLIIKHHHKQEQNIIMKYNKSINQEKVNMYCLGLICASCMTKIPCAQFFDNHNYTMNIQLLREKVEVSLKKYLYSQNLKFLITDLLNLNPSYRPGYDELVYKIDGLINIHVGTFLSPEDEQSCNKKRNYQIFHLEFHEVYVRKKEQRNPSKQIQIISEPQQEDEEGEEKSKEEEEEEVEPPQQESKPPLKITSQPVDQNEIRTSEPIQEQPMRKSQFGTPDIRRFNQYIQSINQSRISEYEYQKDHETLDEKIKKIRENIINQQYTRSQQPQNTESQVTNQDAEEELDNHPNYHELDQSIQNAMIKSRQALEKYARPKEHFTPINLKSPELQGQIYTQTSPYNKIQNLNIQASPAQVMQFTHQGTPSKHSANEILQYANFEIQKSQQLTHRQYQT